MKMLKNLEGNRILLIGIRGHDIICKISKSNGLPNFCQADSVLQANIILSPSKDRLVAGRYLPFPSPPHLKTTKKIPANSLHARKSFSSNYLTINIVEVEERQTR